MSVEALIADFNRRGIRFIPNPPKLVVEPASRLTEWDRALIRAYKAEMLAMLADAKPPPRPPTLRWYCCVAFAPTVSAGRANSGRTRHRRALAPAAVYACADPVQALAALETTEAGADQYGRPVQSRDGGSNRGGHGGLPQRSPPGTATPAMSHSKAAASWPHLSCSAAVH